MSTKLFGQQPFVVNKNVAMHKIGRAPGDGEPAKYVTGLASVAANPACQRHRPLAGTSLPSEENDQDKDVDVSVCGSFNSVVANLTAWTKSRVEETMKIMRKLYKNDVSGTKCSAEARTSKKMTKSERIRRAISVDMCSDVKYRDLFAEIFSQPRLFKESGGRLMQLGLEKRGDTSTENSNFCPYHRRASNANFTLNALKPKLSTQTDKIVPELINTPNRSGSEIASYDEVDYHETYAEKFTHTSTITLMRLVFNKPDASLEGSVDVFVYYHKYNRDWILSVLIPTLQLSLGKSTRSEDDFDFGSVELEEFLQSIGDCNYVILALSEHFIKHLPCRLFTMRAYDLKPYALLPIALPPLPILHLVDDMLFNSLIQTNGLIYWSEVCEKQALFWARLEGRLNDSGEGSDRLVYSGSVDIMDIKKRFVGIPLTKRFCSCVCSRPKSGRQLERQNSC